MVSDEDPSVQAVAGTVRAIAREEAGFGPSVTFVEETIRALVGSGVEG